MSGVVAQPAGARGSCAQLAHPRLVFVIRAPILSLTLGKNSAKITRGTGAGFATVLFSFATLTSMRALVGHQRVLADAEASPSEAGARNAPEGRANEAGMCKKKSGLNKMSRTYHGLADRRIECLPSLERQCCARHDKGLGRSTGSWLVFEAARHGSPEKGVLGSGRPLPPYPHQNEKQTQEVV